jgi:hypothetical protein
LTVDLWWIHERKALRSRRFRRDKVQALGPHRFCPRIDSLGANPVIDRPTDIGPHDRAEGLVAFDVGVVPGLDAGDESGDEIRVHPDLRLYARLIDDISGAEIEKTLDVKRRDQS